MARSKLNLSVILKHLDLRNFEVYAALAAQEVERKELERLLSYILPLWMSGTTDAREQFKLLVDFNSHVNLSWWELEGHSELRAKVLAAIGTGKVLQHDYQARFRRKTGALFDFLTRRYPDIRKEEVRLWCITNSEYNLVELCRDYGIQESEREPIINEYRALL